MITSKTNKMILIMVSSEMTVILNHLYFYKKASFASF